MIDKIYKQISQSISVKEQILKNEALIEQIKQAAILLINGYKAGNKTLLAGNGGSAADAQHIAGEFVSRFLFDRPGLASIALTTDTSILTAIGNDYGYEKLFARQVQAQAVKGDIFIGISTSGNSKNVIEALIECKKKSVTTIGLTGEAGGKMTDLCDICIRVPSNETPRIQEAHIMIGHILCYLVEEDLFGNKEK
ncbi:MAG: D-sedoheptulose 7-phosphate isomerase [Ignavibacteriaceae bacterium]|nr:D-sedoheptulose 7-phosphate isomerase [Ignavibacteriaceae bacterium]